MRALVMDFPADRKTFNIADEFLFGPALLASPMTEAGATSRSVYLPAEATWYDFWTGASLPGGSAVSAAAPLDRIPLFVLAGSIIPMGPELQYTNEKPADPIELRIYPGADGRFALYEDDGESYAYEKNERAIISLDWKDATKTLSFGAVRFLAPGTNAP